MGAGCLKKGTLAEKGNFPDNIIITFFFDFSKLRKMLSQVPEIFGIFNVATGTGDFWHI